jgi:hypothetical protein
MPTAPIMLPRRAVRGWFIRRRSTMNSAEGEDVERPDEVRVLEERGGVHQSRLLNISSMRSVTEEAADHVDRAEGDRDHQQEAC